uniref:Uncharacterized protein n=1 Tax=Anguilla anguilla TaxID=7936 RepID=A0A0E9U127_ANGAN
MRNLVNGWIDATLSFFHHVLDQVSFGNLDEGQSR